MFTPETTALLQKSLPEQPSMVCGRSLKHDIDDLAAGVFQGLKLAVIDDSRTAQAFGDRVFQALKGRFQAAHITLEGTPAADMAAVEEVRDRTAGCDALVAVGSGTINDICKYASFRDGKPYMVFPTAASMNGYLSANASISVEGYKKTMAAQMPRAVFCDLSVIAAAPARLSRSGLGDSLARPTAQADWLLSHLLLATPYDETPFALLKPLEPHLLDNARGIAMGDLPSIELLVETLLLSGLGMTIARGSYPASQGEHSIAHTMGMLAPGGRTFHGEEIGVTTLLMAGIQEALLRKPPALRPQLFDEQKMTELFGAQAAAEAKKAYAVKRDVITGSGDIKNWDNTAARIESIMIPPSRIQAVLKDARAPDTPEALGWDGKLFDTALMHARFLRERFTFLDLF